VEQGMRKKETVNVQGLAGGHYLIRATTEDGTAVSKPFNIIR
jgi:hypothetical protein